MSRAKTDQADEPFLQRWSRRKRQTQIPEPAPADEPAEAAQSAIMQRSTEPAKPFEQLTDADMPTLESLDEHSDYRPFLAPKVSAELRRLALRKLFHQPVFNSRDGLCEYDGDYTQFEPLGNIVTADMKFMQALAEQRDRERADSLASADSAAPSMTTAQPDDVEPVEQADEQAISPDSKQDTA